MVKEEGGGDSILDEAGEIKAREILERLAALRGRVKEGLKEKVSVEILPSRSRSKLSFATSHRESSSLRANGSASTQAAVQAAVLMDDGRFRNIAATLHSHRHAIALHPSNAMVASGSPGGGILAWPHRVDSHSAAVHPSSGSTTGRWSVAEELPRRGGHKDVVWDLVFISPCPVGGMLSGASPEVPDQNFVMLASASADKSVKIWLRSNREASAVGEASAAGEASAVGETQAASEGVGSSFNAHRKDAENAEHKQGPGPRWQLLQTLEDETSPSLRAVHASHLDDVTCLAHRPLSPHADDRLAILASGSDDCLVKLWVWKQARLDPREPTAAAAAAAAGATAAAKASDHAGGGWLLGTTLHGHAARISSVSFSKGGRLLASADHDGNVLLWGEAAAGEATWKEGRAAAGRLASWSMQCRIRHESPVLAMTLGECQLDARVHACLRSLAPAVWDEAEGRGGSSAMACAGKVAAWLREKALRASRRYDTVRKLHLAAERSAVAGMRDPTERGEVLAWLRGVGLREVQAAWEGMMDLRVWTWSSLAAMTKRDADMVCQGAKGDGELLWREIELVGEIRDSDGAQRAGREVAHALATVDDAVDLEQLRPDKRLKHKKPGFVWDGLRWRDDAAQIDEWRAFFTRWFGRFESQGGAVAKELPPDERAEIVQHMAAVRVLICSSLKAGIKTYKAVDVRSRFEQAVQLTMQAAARQLGRLAKTLGREKDSAVQAHVYADRVSVMGFSEVVSTCEELDVVEGMRVKIRGRGRGACEVVEVVKELRGARLRVRAKVNEGQKDGKSASGAHEAAFEEREVGVEEVTSLRGIRMWRLSVVSECEALRQCKGVGKEELAFAKGDTIVLKRRAEDKGWVWAERKDALGRGEGLVREQDLRPLEHTSSGVLEWLPFKSLVMDDAVTSLCPLGNSGDFLAAASGRFVLLLVRRPCGFRGFLDADKCPLNSHHAVIGAPEEQSAASTWECVDMFQGHGFSPVHSLATSSPENMEEAAVLVSGGGDRQAAVWDLSKWAAALRARDLLEAWMYGSLLKRVREQAVNIIRKTLEGGDARLEESLLLDEKNAHIRRREAKREVAVLEDEGSDVLGHEEMLEEARQRLHELQQLLELHWEAKEALMEAVENAVWDKGMQVEQSVMDRLVERYLREMALMRRLEDAEWDQGESEADARQELQWLRSSRLSNRGGLETAPGSRRDLEMVFRLLDTDGSGELDAKELQTHVSSLGLGKALHSQAMGMMAMADKDSDSYLTKGSRDEAGEEVGGREVAVHVVEAWEAGADGVSKFRGRRPERVILKTPSKGEESVVWEREWEENSEDPRHPQYMKKLIEIMGSANPKTWARAAGHGTVDLAEFVEMFSPEDVGDDDDDMVFGQTGFQKGGKSTQGARSMAASPAKARKQGTPTKPLTTPTKAGFLTGNASLELLPDCEEGSELSSHSDGVLQGMPLSPMTKALREWREEKQGRLHHLDRVLMDVANGLCGDVLEIDSLLFSPSTLGNFSDKGEWLSCLSDTLAENKSITSLSITRMAISHEEACELCSSLVKHPRLRHLNLAGNREMGASGCAAACRELAGCVALESLDLSGCGAEDEGAEAAALELLGKGRLQKLVMRKSQISDKGGISLARALSRDSRLAVLDLTDNLIGDEGCAALCDVLLTCDKATQNLTTTNATICSISLELNPACIAARARLGSLLSDSGTALRQSLGATYNPLTSFARYLHGLAGTEGEGKDFVRLIAGGDEALDPLPVRMPAKELESALRFVRDPEDAALLLRWFRPVAHLSASGRPAGLERHTSKAAAMQGSGSAQRLADKAAARASEGEAADPSKSEAAAFRQKTLSRRGQELALADEDKWASESERMAALAKKSNMPWGRLVPWREGMQGVGGAAPVLLGKRKWLMEHVREMSGSGFSRHAREVAEDRSELARVGLDGSSTVQGHGWIDVRVVAYDAGKKRKEVGAVCWLRAVHEKEGLVQGPFRTSEAKEGGVWRERFRFGLSKLLAPEYLLVEVSEGGGHGNMFSHKMPLTWYNMDRPEGIGATAPHVVFDGRAVRIEARTGRDAERWFDLGSGRRILLQTCYRCDSPLPLDWSIDESPSCTPSLSRRPSELLSLHPGQQSSPHSQSAAQNPEGRGEPNNDSWVLASKHWDMVRQTNEGYRVATVERICRILGEAAAQRTSSLKLVSSKKSPPLSLPSISSASALTLANIRGEEPSRLGASGHGVRTGFCIIDKYDTSGGTVSDAFPHGLLGSERWHQDLWGLDISSSKGLQDAWHPPLVW